MSKPIDMNTIRLLLRDIAIERKIVIHRFTHLCESVENIAAQMRLDRERVEEIIRQELDSRAFLLAGIFPKSPGRESRPRPAKRPRIQPRRPKVSRRA